MRLLAIGYSVRHIACSGARASHDVIAADAFGDIDTRKCSSAFITLNFPLREDEMKYIEIISECVDRIIVGSGCEIARFSEKLAEKIAGNSPDKMREAANKEKLSEYLDDLGIPHPRTYAHSEISSSSARFPLVAKPIYGGGGTSNFMCRNERELMHALKSHRDIIFQEFIKGTPASVSVISTGKEAVSICVNEQLIGLKSLNCTHQFLYCGNISPLKTKIGEKMCNVAEILVLELGLKGSNGVDFVVTDDGFFVIEVNPRFQGSLDTVELCTGLNVVDAHLKAVCEGELPCRVDACEMLPHRGNTEKRHAARLILFAERNCIISDFERLRRHLGCVGCVVRGGCGGGEGSEGDEGDEKDGGDERGERGERGEGSVSERDERRGVSGVCRIADIPPRGRVLRRGEPVASGIGVGNSRNEAFEAAMKVVRQMRRHVI